MATVGVKELKADVDSLDELIEWEQEGNRKDPPPLRGCVDCKSSYCDTVTVVILLLECFSGRPIDFRVSLRMFYHSICSSLTLRHD